MFYKYAVLVIGMLIRGCASKYYPIAPKEDEMEININDTGLYFDTIQNVLQNSPNRKYKRIARKKSLHFAGIKILNNTGRKLNIGKDIIFTSNNTRVNIINKEKLIRELKRERVSFLTYLLLSPIAIQTSPDAGTNGQNSFPIPVGFFVGGLLTTHNFIKADKANADLENEINQTYLKGRVLYPSQTATGLIGYYAERELNIVPELFSAIDQIDY
jgi:hypothetical protein